MYLRSPKRDFFLFDFLASDKVLSPLERGIGTGWFFFFHSLSFSDRVLGSETQKEAYAEKEKFWNLFLTVL